MLYLARDSQRLMGTPLARARARALKLVFTARAHRAHTKARELVQNGITISQDLLQIKQNIVD